MLLEKRQFFGIVYCWVRYHIVIRFCRVISDLNECIRLLCALNFVLTLHNNVPVNILKICAQCCEESQHEIL